MEHLLGCQHLHGASSPYLWSLETRDYRLLSGSIISVLGGLLEKKNCASKGVRWSVLLGNADLAYVSYGGCLHLSQDSVVHANAMFNAWGNNVSICAAARRPSKSQHPPWNVPGAASAKRRLACLHLGVKKIPLQNFRQGPNEMFCSILFPGFLGALSILCLSTVLCWGGGDYLTTSKHSTMP